MLRLAYLLTWTLASVVRAQGDQLVLANERSDFPRLNFSSPSPLIFHSVFGLLQQWPNTFFEFGHSIIPCKVPKNTNLFHASGDADPLPNPEWFAFDASMSFAILGNLPNSHMHTYRTQRDVECLYFDGASASLWHSGDTDSQMSFLYNSTFPVPKIPRLPLPPELGNVSIPNLLFLEYERAKGLCNFIHERGLGGLGWGYEGVVRMNAGFELIWCNFTSPSARLISWINVTAPREVGKPRWKSPQPDEPPHLHLLANSPLALPLGEDKEPQRRIPLFDSPFDFASVFEWFRETTKRYGFLGGKPGRGETRVKLDNCGLFTFYDPGMTGQEGVRLDVERKKLNLTSNGYWLAPDNPEDRDAALVQLARRRRDQRPANVSDADGLYMREVVERSMRRALSANEDRSCSGIDWTNIAGDIVSAYSSELYVLSNTLARYSSLEVEKTRDWLAEVRVEVHDFFKAFYEYPHFTNETLSADFDMSSRNSVAALQRCSTQYDPPEGSQLTHGEALTHRAISDVLSAICGTILPIFLQTERTWLAHFNNQSISAPLPPAHVLNELSKAVDRNRRAVEELRAWLGWVDQWTVCNPGCGIGQLCYLPMWPILALPVLLKIGNGTVPPMDEVQKSLAEYLWEPTCVDEPGFPPGW